MSTVKSYWVVSVRGRRVLAYDVRPAFWAALLGLLFGVRIVAGPFATRAAAREAM